MFESAARGWLAGCMDMLGYYVALFSTVIGVNVMNGHSTPLKVVFLTLMGFANLLGTKSGQVIGSHLLRRFPSKPNPEIVQLRIEIAELRQLVQGDTHE